MQTQKLENKALNRERRETESAGHLGVSQGVCVSLCSHWSYIGVGWQLGIESCVVSVNDALELADHPPHVKTCINLDARAYELIAEKFPEVVARLKHYLAAGKVELVGGTYAQPMGTLFSGESSIRQIAVGREAIRKALDYEMVTFLEEEECTHPQIPQILAGAGYRYASLAQMDTFGKAGCPVMEFNAIRWQGLDGTALPTIPKNAGFTGMRLDKRQLVGSDAFQKLAARGKPLFLDWIELGWEAEGRAPLYLTVSAAYQAVVEKLPLPVEFVTCKEYLDKYGPNPKETIYLPMDGWNKLLTWGIGGDQLRVLDRKVEGLLLAAESFDAITSLLGASSQTACLEQAWKDLLTAQSHDVCLCEYTRWAGGTSTGALYPLEDYHGLTWGAIGYRHLDAAQQQGQAALDAALDHLVKRINSEAGKQGTKAITVFNPQGWERNDIVVTERIYPVPERTHGVRVKDRQGRVVPSQIVKPARDPDGNLVAATLAFAARQVPAIGYDTYYLEFTPEEATGPDGVRIDERDLTLENEHIRVRIDPTTGGVASLVAKPSGRETIDGAQGAFPVFTGRSNPIMTIAQAVYHHPPAVFDSSKSKAKIDWLERGPARATARARFDWETRDQIFDNGLETWVTVTAGLPYVEVRTRIVAIVPPLHDPEDKQTKINQNDKEGYWLSFTPAFSPEKVVRDFPLGVEATRKSAFHALSFADLVGKDVGLLVLHAGTQYFRRDELGRVSNLVMREWESSQMGEYGWPKYAEYRHALLPHAETLTNAARLRASSAFSRPLIARVGPCQRGKLPSAKGFVTVTPETVQLSALRRKAGAGIEIRAVEVEGRSSPVDVKLDFPVTNACETNLLGTRVADVDREASQFHFSIHPWKIRTFEITPHGTSR